MSQRSTRHNQHGAALLTAMIIVTLVATLTSGMVWQQWRAVQVEAAERDRAQSSWILVGALDWARLILKEDGRTSADFDHLGEPWAVPLAEARLSTFLAADKNNADDGPEAFMAGSIADAQSRYNLLNLLATDEAGAKTARATLKRLCDTLGTPSDTADRLAGALLATRAAGTPGQDAAAPLMPRSASQLGWLGLEPEIVRVLAPHVVLLQRPTPVNVNTASKEVLVAVVDKLDLATAERLVQMRQRTPFRSIDSVKKEIGELATTGLAVNSSYFEVRGRIRLGDRVLEQTSLVFRQNKTQVDVVYRDQVSSRDQPAS